MSTTSQSSSKAVKPTKATKAVPKATAAKAVKARKPRAATSAGAAAGRKPAAPGAPRRAANAAKAPKPPKATAPSAEPPKHPKAKLVRDSLTMPKAEYLVIDALKQRSAQAGRPLKKSEVLRAGVKALAAMADAEFAAAVANVPVLKTGRPKSRKTAEPETHQ